MKLFADVKALEIFISSSMAADNPKALELRSMLQTVGKRYELLKYSFIEDRASPGDPDYQMQTGVRDCDAIAMIFHKGRGKAFVRPGILREYQLSVELNKPIFMFSQEGFVPKTEEGANLVSLMRDRKGLYDYKFSSNVDLVDTLERSLFDFMVSSTKNQFKALGENLNKDRVIPELGDKLEELR